MSLHCNAWLDVTVAQPFGSFESPTFMSYAFTTYADVLDDAAVSFPSDDAEVVNGVAGDFRSFAKTNESTDSAAAPMAALLEPMAVVAANVTATCGNGFVDDALNG